jgi:hypothetical protein
MQARRLGWVALFALAMAYLEAATVVYLRRVFGVVDLVRDLAIFDPRIACIEVGREAATLVMLGSLGCAASRSSQARLGFALFAFGLWDALYYVWLRLMLGWPESLFTQDVLFLVPLPWWGPVLTPVLIACVSVAFGACLVRQDDLGRRVRPSGLEWGALFAGILIVLASFMADALRALPASAEDLSRLKPTAFRWELYLPGLGAIIVSLARAAHRSCR